MLFQSCGASRVQAISLHCLKFSRRNKYMHKNRRVRQHVNPLRSQYVQPLEFSAEQWHTVFHDCTKPLHLDLGCGPGLFLSELSRSRPGYNFLGIDIKDEYVQRALSRLDAQGNCHFVCANTLVHLEPLLASLPMPLRAVSTLFSDPWWKKQHAKRRMITATALDLIGARMEASGGVLLVRTDQEVVVEQAVASFAAAQHPWRHAAQAGDEWDVSDPELAAHVKAVLDAPTERLRASLRLNRPVYTRVWELPRGCELKT